MSDIQQSSIFRDIEPLFLADQEELLALLGAASAVALASPSDMLAEAREGLFYSAEPAMGARTRLRHTKLQQAAIDFLKKWGMQLKSALCGRRSEYHELLKKGREGLHVLVATIAASLAAKIPELAPYNLVLTLAAVLIVRTGIDAFCEDPLAVGAPAQVSKVQN